MDEVRSETQSSNKWHISDHIWLKSAVRQSPPTRGTLYDHIWSKSTVRQSPPMRGIICLPHLANVCCMTSPPTRGNIFWPHLAEVRCVTRPSTRGKFTFYAKLGQHQLLDMRYSLFIVDFLNAYSMSITSGTTYMASFPKRPNITGAPNQVFKFAISWSV